MTALKLEGLKLKAVREESSRAVVLSHVYSVVTLWSLRGFQKGMLHLTLT